MRGLGALTARQRWVLVATSAVNAMVFFDQTSVTVALPAIQRDFDVTRTTVEWVVGAYLLPLAALIAVSGRLGDVYGRRRTFVAGAILFGAASALCGLAPSESSLIAARVLEGVGAALVTPLALANLTAVLPAERRGWAVGLLATGGTTFLSIGPLAGGLLVATASWRWIFLVNVPIAAAAVAIAIRHMTESRGETGRRLDRRGLALLAGGVTALVFALEHSSSWGLGDRRTLGLIACGLVLLAAFVAVERVAADPLVPLRLLESRPVAVSLAALVAIQYVVLAMTVFLPLYLQNALGYGALAAGLLFVPTVLGTPLLSTTTGRLADRRGAKGPIVAGLALAAVALAWIAALAGRERVAAVLPAFVAFGLARPLVFTPASAAAIAAIPAAARGLASGLVAEARQLGAVLGVALTGALVTAVEVAQRHRLLGAPEARFGPDARQALDSLLAGGASGRRLVSQLPPGEAAQVSHAATDAFVLGFRGAIAAAAALTAIACVTAALLLPAGRRRGAAKPLAGGRPTL